MNCAGVPLGAKDEEGGGGGVCLDLVGGGMYPSRTSWAVGTRLDHIVVVSRLHMKKGGARIESVEIELYAWTRLDWIGRRHPTMNKHIKHEQKERNQHKLPR